MTRALSAALLLLLAGCSDGGGKQVPETPWFFQYSPGMPNYPSANGAGFTFNFPGPPASNHVNYLVQPVAGVAGRVVAEGNVTASADAAFRYDTNANNTCDYPANVRLYFQRRDDDMSGVGPMQFYRWWHVAPLTLAPGPFSITARLDPDQWSSVYGVRGDAAVADFEAAKANAYVAGFTFGGGCFAGHGVYVSPGTASFAVSRFVVE